jgi:homoserine dehydrogenase
MRDALIVLKFGGSVLASEASLPLAVHEIDRWRRSGRGVVAVVSALAGETDALLARAAADDADPHATAALAALGEARAAALLVLSLQRAGLPARSLSPAALGLRAEGEALDALPVELDTGPLRRALAAGEVAVVPGFTGVAPDGRTVLLGRGGSDTTAVFLAARLRARCRLIKDVDGLYAADPAGAEPPPPRYASATFADALATDGSIVQRRALDLAQLHGLTVELARVNGARPTRIGATVTRCAAPDRPRRLRVALLGLGAVGGGVAAHLLALPELFELTAVCVRDPRRPRALPPGVPVTDDPLEAAHGADVLVEALGGCEPARTAIAAALRRGTSVVTANKAVLAAHGAELEALARANGAALRWSAAAGGAMPLLATLRRLALRGGERAGGGQHGGVRRLDAVLNGTTNFVLDEVARGAGLPEALERARHAGLAERDPQRDLSGRDAADKLVLAAHALTGRWLDPRDVRCEPLDARALAAAAGGATVRQVATLELDGGRIAARVRPRELPAEHPLARVRGAGNAARLRTEQGVVRLAGRGAGRWPAAQSVLADLLALARRPDSARGRRIPAREARPSRAMRPTAAFAALVVLVLAQAVGAQASPWTDLGGGLAGATGIPELDGTGTLAPSTPGALILTHAAPSAPCLLFFSLLAVSVPFKGGTLSAFPPYATIQLVTGPGGGVQLTWVALSAALPPGVELYFQLAVQDAGAPNGAAISNLLRGITQP